MDVVQFNLNDALYGVPVLLVEEVFRPVHVAEVPRADRRIAGLLNLRGKSAVVIDLRRCLGHPDLPPGAKRQMIMIETADGQTAEATEQGLTGPEEPVVLLVDKVRRIAPLDPNEILPPPAHVRQTFIEGVAPVEPGRYLTLLSISKLTEALESGL
jgi:chemotaxis signal transduction protein